MSRNLAKKLRLGLEELATVREQLTPLIALAFRLLFRGASIVLMRWEKLSPLVQKVGKTYVQTAEEIGAFVRFIEGTTE